MNHFRLSFLLSAIIFFVGCGDKSSTFSKMEEPVTPEDAKHVEPSYEFQPDDFELISTPDGRSGATNHVLSMALLGNGDLLFQTEAQNLNNSPYKFIDHLRTFRLSAGITSKFDEINAPKLPLEMSPDGKYFIGSDGIYNRTDDTKAFDLPFVTHEDAMDDGSIQTGAFSDDGSSVAVLYIETLSTSDDPNSYGYTSYSLQVFDLQENISLIEEVQLGKCVDRSKRQYNRPYGCNNAAKPPKVLMTSNGSKVFVWAPFGNPIPDPDASIGFAQLINLDDGEILVLSDLYGSIAEVRMRSNGRYLLYASHEGRIYLVDTRDPTVSIRINTLDGFAYLGGHSSNPRFSPDGRKILFLNRGQNSEMNNAATGIFMKDLEKLGDPPKLLTPDVAGVVRSFEIYETNIFMLSNLSNLRAFNSKLQLYYVPILRQ